MTVRAVLIMIRRDAREERAFVGIGELGTLG
jgi:hypothetical protein